MRVSRKQAKRVARTETARAAAVKASAKSGVRRADAGRTRLNDFWAEALVVCPRCSGPAWSRRLDPAATDWTAARRLVCGRCAYTAEWEKKSGAVAAAGIDPYFRRPVWLSTPCCGEMLWAYNPAHLDFLAAFVGARIRERRRDPVHGWSNAAIASRLPAWLKVAKNRAAILKGVERLRRRVAEAIERA